MNRIVATAAAFALILPAAGAAHAQERPETQAAAAVDPAKVALIQRYFEAIQLRKLMNGMMQSMVGPMLAQQAIPEEKRDVVSDTLLESFDAVMPQMMDAYIAIYADAFTLEELEGLVAFYEGPVGRSLVSKSVMLTRESGDLLTRFAPIMEREMRTRLCARIECPAATPVAPAVKR